MPQSLNLTLVHLIFSTKNRMPLLTPDVRPDLHAYLATVARHGDGECYRGGGVADHVHLAIRLSRTVSLADLVSELKTSFSKWLKDRSPALVKFSWQRGYAAFSIGPHAVTLETDPTPEIHIVHWCRGNRAMTKRLIDPQLKLATG